MNLKQRYYSLPPLVAFLLNATMLALLWLLFYKYLRYLPWVHIIYESITQFLTFFLLHATRLVLELSGLEIIVNEPRAIISIPPSGGVCLLRGCLARNLLMLFAGYIIAFPGNIKSKLWFIPLGLLLINIINVVRIGGLTFFVWKYPDADAGLHHDLFNYAVYIIIFFMWRYWTIKYGRTKTTTIKT